MTSELSTSFAPCCSASFLYAFIRLHIQCTLLLHVSRGTVNKVFTECSTSTMIAQNRQSSPPRVVSAAAKLLASHSSYLCELMTPVEGDLMAATQCRSGSSSCAASASSHSRSVMPFFLPTAMNSRSLGIWSSCAATKSFPRRLYGTSWESQYSYKRCRPSTQSLALRLPGV